jgi:hypothetical protein
MAKICEMLLCAAFSIGIAVAVNAQNAPAPTTQPLEPGVSRVTSPPVGKIAGQTRYAAHDPVDDLV